MLFIDVVYRYSIQGKTVRGYLAYLSKYGALVCVYEALQRRQQQLLLWLLLQSE